jgi:hypothetical protein
VGKQGAYFSMIQCNHSNKRVHKVLIFLLLAKFRNIYSNRNPLNIKSNPSATNADTLTEMKSALKKISKKI